MLLTNEHSNIATFVHALLSIVIHNVHTFMKAVRSDVGGKALPLFRPMNVKFITLIKLYIK